MDKIKVMIIDKQVFYRAGLCRALSEQADLEILDCEPDSELALKIEEESPDVILLDIDSPSLNGLKLGREITRRYPFIRLIVLSPTPDNEELFETIKTGAAAYLSKNTNVEELGRIIRKVCRGEYPINDSILARPNVAERILRQFQDIVLMGKNMETVAAPLTRRETEILTHIAEGKSNKEIARVLNISEQTIKNHVSSIFRKLNANDRAHAVVLAIRQGLISLD